MYRIQGYCQVTDSTNHHAESTRIPTPMCSSCRCEEAPRSPAVADRQAHRIRSPATRKTHNRNYTGPSQALVLSFQNSCQDSVSNHRKDSHRRRSNSFGVLRAFRSWLEAFRCTCKEASATACRVFWAIGDWNAMRAGVNRWSRVWTAIQEVRFAKAQACFVQVVFADPSVSSVGVCWVCW
jgi:hypothetical protein